MTKAKAESRLKKQKQNCNLTRYNHKEKKYILSVCWFGKLRHFELTTGTNHEGNFYYEIKGTQKPFEDFYQLLNFYREYPLDHEIRGIGYFLDINEKSRPFLHSNALHSNENRKIQLVMPAQVLSQIAHP